MRDYRPKSPPTCYDVKPGRPKSENQRTHAVSSSITEAQWKFLCSECEKLNMSKSAYLCMLIEDMMSLTD